MNGPFPGVSRRGLLLGGVAAGVAMLGRGVFAEHLDATPAIEEGPYYPYHHLPLDTDNDLIVVGNSTTEAVGTVTHLGGRILDSSGNPIKNALVEIWQCDANGVYIEMGTAPNEDKNFQGYGKFMTGADGGYRFRTIKPVPYNGRLAPHIHFIIKKGSQRLLTTQLFIRGYKDNTRDGVYRQINDPVDRELASADFLAVKGSKIGELSANFDVIVGRTPADQDDHTH